ncbi:hypothetical protein ZWY2020_005599 [Hordeum vulgare]|nr:hypothetical protein ZWY2020_005599 [Hordeum vulgare]
MSSTMWVWREELFKLSAMPSLPITAPPLRHIYGEEDLAIPALKPSESITPSRADMTFPAKLTRFILTFQ